MLVEDVTNQLKLYLWGIHEVAKALRFLLEVSNFQFLESHSLQTSICDGFQPKTCMSSNQNQSFVRCC